MKKDSVATKSGKTEKEEKKSKHKFKQTLDKPANPYGYLKGSQSKKELVPLSTRFEQNKTLNISQASIKRKKLDPTSKSNQQKARLN